MAQSNDSRDTKEREVGETVNKWLVEEGWHTSSQSGPDLKFALLATSADGKQKIVIGQRKDKADQLTIQANLSLAGKDAERFGKFPQKQRREFLWNLRLELLHMDVEFSGLADPPSKITVSEPIYFDALTKDNFMQRFSEVKKALLFVLWSLQSFFEEPPPQMGFIKG